MINGASEVEYVSVPGLATRIVVDLAAMEQVLLDEPGMDEVLSYVKTMQNCAKHALAAVVAGGRAEYQQVLDIARRL